VKRKEEHRQIFTSLGQWLNDDLIIATQNVLKEQFPEVGGLQASSLAQKLAMDPQPGEFVQVLNVSQSHWITVSTIGCPAGSVNVYDSLHWKLSSHTKKVLADLMRTEDKAITVNYTDVQWQSGASDCGLFALAFATSLCTGQDPVTTLYDQAQMRSHLLFCLGGQKIVPFPCKTKGRRGKKTQRTNTERIPVFCICRLPNDGKDMIQCSTCGEWFHRSCIRVSRKFFTDRKLTWFCSHCGK